MSATEVVRGAWAGDAARKQAAIQAARQALDAGGEFVTYPFLDLALPEHPDRESNVYCLAYGTADPVELEARSGLPIDVLLLVSAALAACGYSSSAFEPGVEPSRPRLVAAVLAALESIPVGADATSIARCYVADLLDWLVGVHDHGGHGLTQEQQSLIRELAALHAASGTAPAAFRPVRRAITEATGAASNELEVSVMGFVESLAWPMAGLVGELPPLVNRLHHGLCPLLSPDQPTPEERDALDAYGKMFAAVSERLRADPSLEEKVLFAQAEAAPESVLVNAPAFQAGIQRRFRVAAQSYAPVAIGLLIGALRKA